MIEVNLQVRSNINKIPMKQPIYYRGRLAKVKVIPYLSPDMHALAKPLAQELELVLQQTATADQR